MNTIFDERAKWISDGSRFVAESDAVGSTFHTASV